MLQIGVEMLARFKLIMLVWALWKVQSSAESRELCGKWYSMKPKLEHAFQETAWVADDV